MTQEETLDLAPLDEVLEEYRGDLSDHIGRHLIPCKQKLLDRNGLFVAPGYSRATLIRPLRNTSGFKRWVSELKCCGLGNGNDTPVDFLDETQD